MLSPKAGAARKPAINIIGIVGGVDIIVGEKEVVAVTIGFDDGFDNGLFEFDATVAPTIPAPVDLKKHREKETQD